MTDDDRVAQTQIVVGHRFACPALLLQALTHPSAADGRRPNNQRLEFLGDSVLGMVVAEALFRGEPTAAEGLLSRRRATLVGRLHLASVAEQIGLGPLLVLGPALTSHKLAPATWQTVLADALEAVIGALYLDGGLAATRPFIEGSVLTPDGDAATASDETPSEPTAGSGNRDAKTRLQELAQATGPAKPTYTVVGRTGPDHAPLFTVAVALGDETLATGTGASRKAAEQAAATLALTRLTTASSAHTPPHPTRTDAKQRGRPTDRAKPRG